VIRDGASDGSTDGDFEGAFVGAGVLGADAGVFNGAAALGEAAGDFDGAGADAEGDAAARPPLEAGALGRKTRIANATPTTAIAATATATDGMV